MAKFCCAVCPHELSCQDLAEATFATPEEIIDDDE